MFKNIVFFVGLFLFAPFSSFSQGELMLVGGGSETDGGWSDIPYAWLLENATNGKVAIVSYTEADEWLPNYFKSLGAVAADNITISSRQQAEAAGIFDTLNSYDAIFFKGGDQNLYYQYYKNTPVQEAVESIYNRGGVIGGTSAGMAILSGVIFTASQGSAYPIDALQNINSSYINLADDFLPFYPNYIFDTHFIERGRTARLIGFLAHWYHNQNELLRGIGIDDRTALCISAEGVGTVYGTGAASVFVPEAFEISDNQIINSSVKGVQLIHGQAYDLHEQHVLERSLGQTSQPTDHNMYYNVFGSGVSSISDNEQLLQQVVQSIALPGGVIIIATAENLLTQAYADFFANNLDRPVLFISASAENNDTSKAALRNAIRQSALVVILEGTKLTEFIEGGPTGQLLASHMKRNNMTTVFLGPDVVPLAGKSYSSNVYSDPFNAYYNELEFREGLSLLPSMTIAARAYELDAKDYYENVTSSVVDRLLIDQLKYGVYLTGNSYFSYTVNESAEAILSTGGTIPSVIAHNSSTRYEQSSEEVSEGVSRLQYAFDSLIYKVVKGTNISLGKMELQDQEEYELEEEPVLANLTSLSDQNFLKENPVRNYLEFTIPIQEVKIFDMIGRLVFEVSLSKNATKIKIGHLPYGQYNVVVKGASDKIYYHNKIIKSN